MNLSALFAALLLAFSTLSVLGNPIQEPPSTDVVIAANRATTPSSVLVNEPVALKAQSRRKKRFFSSFLEDQGWTMHIDEWDFAYPVPRASEVLQVWYETVYHMVNTNFQFLDELQHFVIQYGPLRMRFDCDQAPIEWPMVALITDLLSSAASLGWEGLYQIRFRHLRSHVTIVVGLSVLWYSSGG